MSRRSIVPALALALAVAGCGSHAAAPAAIPSASASDTPPATPSVSATPGGPIVLTDAVALNRSRGLTEPTSVWVDRPGGTTGVLAVPPDGGLVMVAVQQPSPAPDAEFDISQSKLEIVDQLVHLADAPGTAQEFAAGSRLVWRDGSNWEVADFNRD